MRVTRKLLIITNIITLSILLLIVIRHFRFIMRQSDRNAILKTENNVPSDLSKTESEGCKYSLSYFDFHFKKETANPTILMFGNSLIRNGDWPSLLGRNDVVNRGISGDKLECEFSRLKYLTDLSPKICFIEGGVNDIPANNMDTLFANYVKIVDWFKDRKIIPVINLLTFISPKAGNTWSVRKDYKRINDSIKILNSKLKTFAVKNEIDFINLNQSISDTTKNVLLNQYTIDGVHYTKSGYQLWTKKINEILKKRGV